MVVLRRAYLLFGLSVSVVLSWQVVVGDPLQPAQFMGIGSANANGGGEGGGGGGGTAPATIKNVSLETLLGMNRSEIGHLRKLNYREDTDVVIEGFPKNHYTTRMVLRALIDDRRAATRVLRALRGVTDEKKRRKLIAEYMARAARKTALLTRDLKLTGDQIVREKDRIGFGPGVKVVETPRLRTLRQTWEEQRLQLRAAERFGAFLNVLW